MKMASKSRSAFTLAELLIVIAVVIILTSITINGMVQAQQSYIFNNNFNAVLSLVRQARSFAVTGRSQLDYTDYDQDGDKKDKVAPANYGVYFDTAGEKVVFFADIHDDGMNAEGEFVAGKDLILAETQIPDTLELYVDPGADSYTVFFSPIFADTTFYPALAPGTTLFTFGVKDSSGIRARCAAIHPISGVPEQADCL